MRLLAVLFVWCLAAAPLRAHPGGHPAVGQHARLVAEADALALRYTVELGEMKVLELRPTLGLAEDAPFPRATAEAYAHASLTGWLAGLTAELDGVRAPFVPAAVRAEPGPGIGGLTTLRVEIDARAPWGPLGPGPHRMRYKDANFDDVTGYREVVLRSSETARVTGASVPSRDASDALRSPPDAPFGIPSDVREATATIARRPQRLARGSQPPAEAAPLASSGTTSSSPAALDPRVLAVLAVMAGFALLKQGKRAR